VSEVGLIGLDWTDGIWLIELSDWKLHWIVISPYYKNGAKGGNLLVEIRELIKSGLKATKARVKADQEKMEASQEQMKTKLETSQEK
jgi:hypothetical protein